VTMKMKAQDVQNAPAERGVTLPGKRIAGIPLVDSVLCRKATELAQECYQPYLFNHAMRTYLFGALVGRSEKMDFDMELLYLACILHDIGLTSRFMGERPFEIEGAEAAQKFLERQGLSKVKSTNRLGWYRHAPTCDRLLQATGDCPRERRRRRRRCRLGP